MAKIKIDAALFEEIKILAEKAGYSSPDEYVSHILEREINHVNGKQEADDEAILDRLKGLGYIS